MSTIPTFLFNVRSILDALWRLLHYALRFCWALLLPRAVLAARLLAA